MGADFVDYIIGDPHVTPFELAPAMSEKIVQLPDCFWPSDPILPEPEAVSRAEAGLPSGAFVFCCFNSNHKIRPLMFDAWVRLLHRVPDSVLWIRDGYAAMNERFRRQAECAASTRAPVILPGAWRVSPAIWDARPRPICSWIPFRTMPMQLQAMRCGRVFRS